ncbi:MAG: type IV secretory system conjugative DNA transfer family protein, partial [Hyphomonas sp.]|nr:type IV secretory system conjugative DNA transfer family protein [Hyphomonas sp.]
MTKPESVNFLAAFTQDIPRGLSSRFLRTQSGPQARWQSPETILESAALNYDLDNPGGKVLLGALGEKLIGIEDNRHVLTVAGSRAGKSVSLIANLAFYRGSVLCTDPKGELATKTAPRRAALGQKVYVLDPFQRVEGAAAEYRACYNPLTILSRDNPYIIEDAVLIADGLVQRSGQEKDPHWDESAKTLLTGLLLYVAAADLFTDDQRTLVSVRELVTAALTTDPETEDYVLPREALKVAEALEAEGYADIAAAIEGSIRSFFEKAPNERASVLSTARRHTDFLDFSAMKGVVSRHDFDLRDLKRAPHGVSVFLCLPAGRMGMCSRWLRVIINQLMDAMEQERTAPDAPVLVCLDEFPVLGFMKQLEDAAGQVASFGVKLWIILQDWGQGEKLYGQRWESFAANAGIFQAFGNVDLKTTEYISRRLGK